MRGGGSLKIPNEAMYVDAQTREVLVLINKPQDAVRLSVEAFVQSSADFALHVIMIQATMSALG